MQNYNQAINEALTIVDEVEKHYSVKIFKEPTGGKKEPIDRYSAKGARIACSIIKENILKLKNKKEITNG